MTRKRSSLPAPNTGNIVFEKRQCFVSEIVEQAADDLRERASREGKEILISGEPEERLLCDQAWTMEAAGNLVKNALDHTEAGSPGRQLFFVRNSLWISGSDRPHRIF